MCLTVHKMRQAHCQGVPEHGIPQPLPKRKTMPANVQGTIGTEDVTGC